MFLSLPILLLAAFPLFIRGNKQPAGGQCSQENTKPQAGSYQLTGDCDPTTYCAKNNTCVPKGCRRDDFPFGFTDSSQFPPKCPPGQFCPDEEDACQNLLPVGSPCQLNRDDQCSPPPDSADLSDFPNNVNGSICLKNVCMWANKTNGDNCTIDNIPYIAYTQDSEFAFVVSRGDCVPGFYCDAVTTTCLQNKLLGVNCKADKECDSDNCMASGVCGPAADEPTHFPTWVYIAVAAGIFGGMFFTLIGLFFVHRRTRDEEREKRTQYWREQTTLRQNIMQLKETARSGQQGGYRLNNLSDDDRDEGEYPGLINTTTPRRRLSRPGRPKR